MKNDLIITGWGWKEYAVAAAAALRALKGEAEVVGMSKRRLPELLDPEMREIAVKNLEQMRETTRDMIAVESTISWITTVISSPSDV